MINVSEQLKEESLNNRRYYVTANVKLADGTKLSLVKKDFYLSGNSIVDSADSGDFPVGVAIEKTANLCLVNDDERFSGYEFNRAAFTVYMNLQLSDKLEIIKRGTFIVSKKPTTGAKINLTLLDLMSKADKTYKTNLVFPCSAGEVLRDACQRSGLTLGDADFTNSDFQVKKKPSNTTYRAVIGMVAALAGGNARIDENDLLRIVSLKKVSSATIDYKLSAVKDVSYDVDIITVTGVKCEDTIYGNSGYVLDLKDNQLVASNEKAGVTRIGKILTGFTILPFSLSSIAVGYATFGDTVQFKDTKGKIHLSVATDVEFTFGGNTDFSCKAKSVEEQEYNYPDGAQIKVDQALEQVEKDLSAYDIKLKQMNELAANTLGFYTTEEKQEDGSVILYRHNKPLMSESKIIYKSGSDGFFLSTDGGKTWKAGFDSNGDSVMNILYAIGIQSEWINTRGFTAKDNSGNETFRIDAKTGEVYISAKSIFLGGSSVADRIADAIAQANAYTDGKSENLLKGYDLSSKNLEKYWTVSGTVTQGQADPSGGKKAVLLTGTDATDNYISANRSNNNPISGKGKYNFSVYLKALEARTISITFNRKQYSCDVTTNWKKFRFTEEIETPSTEGNNFEIGGFSSVPKGVKLYAYMPFVVRSYTAQEIFNLLTNNGKIPGITMVDGKLYVNASYINSGTMSASRINGGTLTLGGKDNGNGIFRLLDASGNPVVTMFNGGLRIYTSYTDDSHYAYLQFSRTGIKPVVKDGGNETIWQNGIEPSSNWIIRYTSDGKIIINADKMNTDSLAAGTAVINKTLSVLGDTGLRGDAYVAGAFTFKDYFEEVQKSDTRRRPVASAAGSGKRTAYISSITASNGKKAISVKGQYGADGYSEWAFYGDASSDIRLKEHLSKCKINALEAVKQMQMKSFDWKNTGVHQALGLVADDLEKIDPLLTLGGGYNEDGSMNVKQIDRLLLTEYAIKAIQELTETVQEQNNKIKELERRLKGC